MAAPTKPESTAVARPTLSPATEAMIAERRALNEVSRQVANLSWGKALDQNTTRAIAEYCRRFHIDPATEIDILGGRIYRNAAYFLRRGAELLRRGIVTDIQVQHINADTRLDALVARNVPGAQEETDRRALARITHNIPDAAKGAAVVRITLQSGAIVEGANYAGVDKDPVGTANPGKTAESRAYRRAWRLLVDTIPELAAEEGEVESAGAAVSVKIAEAAQVEAQQREASQPKQLGAAAFAGYDLPEPEPLHVEQSDAFDGEDA